MLDVFNFVVSVGAGGSAVSRGRQPTMRQKMPRGLVSVKAIWLQEKAAQSNESFGCRWLQRCLLAVACGLSATLRRFSNESLNIRYERCWYDHDGDRRMRFCAPVVRVGG